MIKGLMLLQGFKSLTTTYACPQRTKNKNHCQPTANCKVAHSSFLVSSNYCQTTRHLYLIFKYAHVANLYVHPSLLRAMCRAESPSNNPTMSNIITIEQEIQVLEQECHAIRKLSFSVMEREAELRHRISEIKKELDELGQNGSEDPKAT